MLPLTKVICPAVGATGCNALVSQPEAQTMYLMLEFTVDAACQAAALESSSIVPCEAKNPETIPAGALVWIAVGVSVHGLGSAPLHWYAPPAIMGTEVGAGGGDAFGSEQILYGFF